MDIIWSWLLGSYAVIVLFNLGCLFGFACADHSFARCKRPWLLGLFLLGVSLLGPLPWIMMELYHQLFKRGWL